MNRLQRITSAVVCVLLLAFAGCAHHGQIVQPNQPQPVRFGATSGPGQSTMARSLSVTMASDQTAIAVSGTVSAQPVAATDGGQNLSLGDTASHAASSVAATLGCWASFPLGNTAAVYCAHATGVTSGNTGTGVEYQPGDRDFFMVSNANKIFCITGTATQNVHIVCE